MLDLDAPTNSRGEDAYAVPSRAFVLLSGGIDSTTCLYIALRQFDEVEAVSIDYGQRHFKEILYAQATCKSLGIKHTELRLDPHSLGGENVMLTDESVVIPNISYDDIKGVSPTYVPFRNGTLLSLVAAHAQKWVIQQIESCIDRLQDPTGMDPDDDDYGLSREELRPIVLDTLHDIAAIFFGAHAEDAQNWAYPDCTPEFIGAMANAIYIGTYRTVRLHTPLTWMAKHEIILKGDLLGVDWCNTWSCYAGESLHCGTCPTCRARKEAFKRAFIVDSTEYADDYTLGALDPPEDTEPPEPPRAA